jgi:hypothetical protein
MNAIHLSIKYCFICGHELETINIKDVNVRREAPFLPVAPEKMSSGYARICMSCAYADWQKNQKEVEVSIADAAESKQHLSCNTEKGWKASTFKEVTDEMAEAHINAEKSEMNAIKQQAKEKKRDQQKADVPNPPSGNSVAIYDMAAVDKLLSDNTEASRDQVARIKGLVKKIKQVSHLKKLVTISEQWSEYCDDLALKFPNFSEVVFFIRNQLALSDIGDKVLRLPPILLVGGPGIGKSELCLTVANDFNTTLKIIDISSA